jgi:hypothetical protein
MCTLSWDVVRPACILSLGSVTVAHATSRWHLFALLRGSGGERVSFQVGQIFSRFSAHVVLCLAVSLSFVPDRLPKVRLGAFCLLYHQMDKFSDPGRETCQQVIPQALESKSSIHPDPIPAIILLKTQHTTTPPQAHQTSSHRRSTARSQTSDTSRSHPCTDSHPTTTHNVRHRLPR